MKLCIDFAEQCAEIKVNLSLPNSSFAVGFGEVHDLVSSGIEDYLGDYEVTPQSEEVSLKTTNKIMRNDMTIRAIPYFCVGNNAGGNTVYIGEI